jgi:integrase
MASIKKRGPYQWQVRIRRKGHPPVFKTFNSKADAEAFAATVESEIARGLFIHRGEAERTTLKEALTWYLEEVTPTKKGAFQETSRIKQLLKTRLAAYSLATLRSSDIAQWRNDLVQAGKAPTTIRNQLTIISQVFERARVEWKMEGLHNPVRGVSLPGHRPGRDRRLKAGEEERLLAALAESSSPWMRPLVSFALETAMRQGEMFTMRWDELRGTVLRLPDTKNGTHRDVPLSTRARAILADLPRSLDGRVFPLRKDSTERYFRIACERAGIEGLRFHDLRHEATSRLFEKGLDMMKVSAITGHKTLHMLKRYTHFEATKLAEELG